MNNFAAVFIILILLTCGAGGFWYVYDYQPLEKKAGELRIEIEGLESQKNELQNIDEEMEELKKEIDRLTEKESKLKMESNQLHTVVPKLLESIEIIANKFSVKFQDVRISPLLRNEEWSELPVELTILGTFKDIGQFLKIVEMRKIVNLADGSMNVSVSAEMDRKTKSPLLSVTLSAKVYIMSSSF